MSFPNFISKKFIFYFIGILAVGFIGVSVFKNGNGKQTVSVNYTDIIQEVAATGKVKPNQSVDLGFDKSGRVASAVVVVGDTVSAGQVLATLEAGEILADLNKAKATLVEENIKLRELKNTSPVSYSDAGTNLQAAIREGFVIADNAVRNRTDQFFKNIASNPYFEVSFTDGNYVHYFKVPSEVTLDINNSRKQVEVILDNWQDRTTNLNQSNIVAESEKALVDLNYIASFLNKVASAVNTFSPAEYTYESTVTTYKTAVSSARTEVANAISDLVSAKDKFNTAPTLGVGGQFEDILAQESKVAQAQSSVAAFEASFNKTIIRAPFSGVVTLQDAKVGNAVSPGNTLISIISQNQMYVEANISEIQIGKIKVGDRVSITFDAFPNEKFSGAVAYIEPGDVIIDGVVNYKIRVNLDSYEERIKSGLTANLKVETARKPGVLAVPLYAVLKEDGKAFANKKIGEKEYQKVPIELGLSGNNGLVEVLSGLSEGDTLEF